MSSNSEVSTKPCGVNLDLLYSGGVSSRAQLLLFTAAVSLHADREAADREEMEPG